MSNGLETNGVLRYDTRHYPFQLENISLSGVVVRLKVEANEPVLPGERCELTFYINQAQAQIRIQAQLVHYSFTLAALQFVDVDQESLQALEGIIERVADEKSDKIFCSSELHRHLGVVSSKACP